MFGNLKKQISAKSMLVYALFKSRNEKRAVFDKDINYTACGSFVDMKISGDCVVFNLTGSRVIVRILDRKIIKVSMLRSGEAEKESPAIYKKDWEGTAFDVEENDSLITIRAGLLKIEASKDKFLLTIKDNEGVINEDYGKGMGYLGDSVYCSKALCSDEKFYGFGEKTGHLNKRGWDTVNWNTDEPRKHDDATSCLYSTIPFFIGLKQGRAYGIYFDNTYKTYYNLGKDDENYYYFAGEGGTLSYYFIYGPSIKEVVEGYTALTGRMKMPPLWSLGFHQSRWSYYPESRVMDIARSFRNRDIPCDAIHLDIDYMDGFRVFTWDKDRFPDFMGMISKLHNMGFKLVTIIDPGVKADLNYDVYKEGLEKDYFCRRPDGSVFIGRVWPMDSAFPDFSNSEVRKWWAGLNRRLIDTGVDGIWNDMNEPSVFDTPTKTIPEGAVHKGDGKPIEHREFHNLYGMMMDMGAFDGIYDKNRNIRPFLLTRSGFAGVQRYSALWTGDNMSLWEHLRLLIPMNCNLGLSGLAFIGNDVGGFGQNCTGELLARWTEAGAFLPLFRNHSAFMTKDQEPWAFGEEIEAICRKYIKLRYRLLPYLYNLLYHASLYGSPVIRPMVYEFQHDEKVYDMEDQFMFGDSMLVAPVMESGRTEREVYLPCGTWADYWTGELYEGSRNVSVKAPLDTLPIYVKSGSILPEWREANNTDEIDRTELAVNIYPGQKCEYLYYEDDGTTLDYEDGRYNIIRFDMEEHTEGYEIHVSKTYSGYDSSLDKYILNIINCFEPSCIECVDDHGTVTPVEYRYESGKLKIQVFSVAGFNIKVLK